MGKSKTIAKRMPFGLTTLDIERTQEMHNENARRPEDMAERWHISAHSARKWLDRAYEKTGVHSKDEYDHFMQGHGLTTFMYDTSQGHIHAKIVRLDEESPGPAG